MLSVSSQLISVGMFTEHLRRWFASCWREPQATEAHNEQFRRRQFLAVVERLPLSSIGNMCITLSIAILFRSVASPLLLWPWLGTQWAIALGNIWLWWRMDQPRDNKSVPGSLRLFLTANLSLAAVLHTLMYLYLFTKGDAPNRLLLVAVISGYLATGTWLFARLPLAGLIWVSTIALGTVVATMIPAVGLPSLFAPLGLIYWALLSAVVLVSSRNFLSALMIESEINRQREMVSLLLHDFEESTSDWLWEVDKGGHLTHVSARLAEALEAPAHSLMSKELVSLLRQSLLLPNDEESQMFAKVRWALSQKEPFRGLVIPTTVQGEKRWWSLTAKPVFGQERQLVGWRGVGSDVTLARKREEERREHLKLRRSLEETERLDALGRLAGGVAHDFNNALTTIVLGTGEALEDTGLSSEGRDVLEDVLRAAILSGQSCRDLLLFSSGQPNDRRERAEIRSSLEAVIGSLRRLVPSDIELSLEVQDSFLYIALGTASLERVVVNLVLNARDSIPRGGRITIGAGTVPANTGETQARVSVWVRDTGAGMDAATQRRIFEPFFTTKAADNGTGLGLATVRKLVEDAGGEIEVGSVAGQGTTFRLTFPLLDNCSLEETSTLAPPIADGHVLVAEDSEDLRRMIVQVFRRAGFQVTEAADGSSGAARIRDYLPGRFDLLCTDGVMPGRSVAELIQLFRTDRRHAPVLVCSGYIQEEVVRRGIEAGHIFFLPKPVQAHSLIASARAAIHQSTTLLAREFSGQIHENNRS